MIFFSRRQTKNHDPFIIKEGQLKYGKFAGKFHRDWVESAFTPTERGEETVGNRVSVNYINLLKWLVLILALTLIGRLFWLQFVRGEYYRAVANGNRLRLERIEANRGIIYDVNHLPLVHNVANFLLYCVPSDLPKDKVERDKIINDLAQLTQKFSALDIKASLDDLTPDKLDYYQPLFLADNIDYEQALKIYLESLSTPGVSLLNTSRRKYDFSTFSLAHVLGYTGKINSEELAKQREIYFPLDYLGKTGVEKSWEETLRGVPGFKQVEVDALGKAKKVVSESQSVPGNNLILSLDAVAQQKLEAIIAHYLKQNGLKRAAAVVLNPNNGEIITLISLPAFDNNTFARGITNNEYQALEQSSDKPLFNRAVSGEYPSGSTIKPVIAAAALEEKIITAATSFLSSGGIRIGQWFFPDWKAGGHGQTNVKKAIAESVNTFFYYIGGGYNAEQGGFIGLGIDRMVTYFRKFLLGTKLGIDLPNEGAGFVPTKEWKEKTKKEKWYVGDTYHVAIGQGDLIVTPLQVAAYTMFFANGGKIYQPHIVKEVTQPNGEVVKKIEPELLASNIVNQTNIQTVREGMRQTVTSGSARSMNSLPVEVAGKTGTAQWSTKKEPHAWFTGFAPYENPELVITILVEEGKGGDFIASPIAREFLAWYFGEYKK